MKMTVKLKIVWHLKSLPEQPVRKVKYLKSHSKLHPPRLQPTTLILERKNNESNLVDDQHRATMSVANDVNKQLNDSFPDVVELYGNAWRTDVMNKNKELFNLEMVLFSKDEELVVLMISNDELMISNDELRSSNDELRSSNDELLEMGGAGGSMIGEGG